MPISVNRGAKAHVDRGMGSTASVKPATIIREAVATDTAVQGLVADPGSATRGELSAAYAGRTASPRGGQRPTLERKPLLAIDAQFPNAQTDHKIVYVDDAIMYGFGQDCSLRASADGGATWAAKLSNTGGLGQWAKQGMFLKTAAGALLTTYHPFDLTAPKVVRSTNGGTSWTDVVAAQANVDYLGPTNICQDPVTGYLYLSEYVTATAAVKATWKISRSTDDGATWTTFHTFQRDAVANPTTAVRHGHGVQWDPVSLRIYFMCGDAENAAGLYRVNAGGTDVEEVVTNADINTAGGFWAGSVGVMFFPDVIAWGVDQTSTSSLMILPRTQIGQATPVVTQGPRFQSTAFYCIRAATDGSEWLMTVSSENGAGGRLDNACHVYRVADNGATVDEVMTVPARSASTFYWIQPISTPLQANTDGRLWLDCNIRGSHQDASQANGGFQLGTRMAWGAAAIIKPDFVAPRFYAQESVSSGYETLTALQKKVFGVIEVPLRAKRLYIIDAHREQLVTGGTGFFYVEVWNASAAALVAIDGGGNMQWQNRSRRVALNEDTAPYLLRSGVLSPGHQLHFRLNELGNGTAEGVAHLTYAWGF